MIIRLLKIRKLNIYLNPCSIIKAEFIRSDHIFLNKKNELNILNLVKMKMLVSMSSRILYLNLLDDFEPI